MIYLNRLSFVAAGAAGALAVMQASVAADSCRYHLSANDHVIALNAIQNLMGRYAHLGHLRGEDTLEELFAMKQPDVSWRTPSGPSGPEGMSERFVKPGEAPRGDVPGQLQVHSMLTPVIEIAADGKTAKGVWDSFGPSISRGTEVGDWLWVKYGVDFIKEDGVWKIWHLQVYALFDTPYDRSITQSAWDRANPGRPGSPDIKSPQAENGQGAGGLERNWSQPASARWIYDGKSAPHGPYIPEPYCTWDPAMSYGKLD